MILSNKVYKKGIYGYKVLFLVSIQYSSIDKLDCKLQNFKLICEYRVASCVCITNQIGIEYKKVSNYLRNQLRYYCQF